MKHYYKYALFLAASEAYKSEVIDTLMEEKIIGDGKDFASREDWIAARMQEWLEQAEIENS